MGQLGLKKPLGKGGGLLMVTDPTPSSQGGGASPDAWSGGAGPWGGYGTLGAGEGGLGGPAARAQACCERGCACVCREGGGQT